MDVDLRKPITQDDQEKILLTSSHADVSYVCIRKPSGLDRAQLEEICQQVQCSLSKVYWLINREKETSLTINHDMVQEVMNQIKADLMNVFISTLKCGHYESQLAVYPAIKPATLFVTPSSSNSFCI